MKQNMIGHTTTEHTLTIPANSITITRRTKKKQDDAKENRVRARHLGAMKAIKHIRRKEAAGAEEEEEGEGGGEEEEEEEEDGTEREGEEEEEEHEEQQGRENKYQRAMIRQREAGKEEQQQQGKKKAKTKKKAEKTEQQENPHINTHICPLLDESHMSLSILICIFRMQRISATSSTEHVFP